MQAQISVMIEQVCLNMPALASFRSVRSAAVLTVAVAWHAGSDLCDGRAGMPKYARPGFLLQCAVWCSGERAVALYAGADKTKLTPALTLLLVDGAELLFGGNSAFWSGINALILGPLPAQRIRNLRVILTCSYRCSATEFAGLSCANCNCPRVSAS